MMIHIYVDKNEAIEKIKEWYSDRFQWGLLVLWGLFTFFGFVGFVCMSAKDVSSSPEAVGVLGVITIFTSIGFVAEVYNFFTDFRRRKVKSEKIDMVLSSNEKYFERALLIP